MGNRENRTGIYELSTDPELADLFRVSLRALTLALRTHTVARVVSYNPATQTATVSVDILQVIKDNLTTPSAADPNPKSTQPPVELTGIPVAWPRTAAGHLTFPLVPGDTGELHVQDRTLQAWTTLGIPTDPVTSFTHSLADSVFHPNIHPAANPITPPTSLTHTVLTGPLIALGALATTLPAGSPLVRGTELAAAFNTYTSTLIAAGALAAAGGAVPPAPPLPPTAVSNLAYIVTATAAAATLATSIATWLSLKSFTE